MSGPLSCPKLPCQLPNTSNPFPGAPHTQPPPPSVIESTRNWHQTVSPSPPRQRTPCHIRHFRTPAHYRRSPVPLPNSASPPGLLLCMRPRPFPGYFLLERTPQTHPVCYLPACLQSVSRSVRPSQLPSASLASSPGPAAYARLHILSRERRAIRSLLGIHHYNGPAATTCLSLSLVDLARLGQSSPSP